MGRTAFLSLLLALAAAAAALAAGSRFRPPDAPARLAFPRDHGSHDEARVEWWYVTGHLEAEGKQRWGFQLTFFRTGIADEPRDARRSRFAARDLFLAHFALTDVSRATFRFAERIHRSGPGAALAREDRLRVVNEDWTLEELDGRFVLHARDGTPEEGDELSLLLVPEKPWVLHGTGGLTRKGSEPDAVSRYVSFTRLATSGWLTSKGTSRAVTGSSWLDHEWGPGVLGKDGAGWDWFAVQLADGRDLMLYRMRGKEGAGTPFSSGTLVERNGRATPLAAPDFSIEETASWTSPRSGAAYPARWTLRVPAAGLSLAVVPLVADQELVTAKSTRVTYWEGACDVFGTAGRWGGKNPAQGPPAGRAYVELTGYAGEGALGTFR